ncbi:DNA repair protein recN [Borrelia hermsii MTW]|nr:DNA repair protein recN [Borrelia hermsii MTW]
MLAIKIVQNVGENKLIIFDGINSGIGASLEWVWASI